MFMRVFLLYVFCVLGIHSLTAQTLQQYMDSVMHYNQINPDKALSFGLEAISKGYEEGPSMLFLKINTRVGQILSEQYIDGQAIKFHNESLKIFSGIPIEEREEKKVHLPPWVLINIGNIYFRNKNYPTAEENYLKALENFMLYQDEEMKNFGLATTYDNLALISIKNKDFKKSKEYFEKASLLRNSIQKSEDILYSKLGFLLLYIEEDNFASVETTFKEICDYYSAQIKEIPEEEISTVALTRNYGYALTRIGTYHMKLKNYDSAIGYFHSALETLASFKVEIPSIKTDLAEAYFLKGNLSKALKMTKTNLNEIKGENFNQLQEKNLNLQASIYSQNGNQEGLLAVKDKLISFYLKKEKNVLNKEFSKLESYFLLTNKQQEINEAKIKYNTYLFLLILVCIFLIFLFISVRLNLNLQKANAHKAETEKKLIEMELKNKNLALINKTKFISQQNENLIYILESTRNKEDTQEKIEAKIETLLTNFKTNERFEKQFDEVYPGFFNKLIKRSKRLTQNDLRLCAFLRLNQTTKEIAQMCGVSLRTIESQKYRLKKKLNLLQDESLVTFVFSVDAE